MDLLRTPWRVGALYLYGLIYISTDFWDFKDFWSAEGGQAVLRVLEVRREKKRGTQSLKSVEKKGARSP